jgi:tetratricopeptide (TPR) repeat protein
MLTSIPNSSVPLRIERYGIAPREHKIHSFLAAELELDQFGYIETESGMIPAVANQFVSKTALTAQITALYAYAFASSDPDKAIEIAKKSLSISPTCDAYNVLAICESNNYEEALEFYRKGQTFGPDVSANFDKLIRSHQVFEYHSMRGYFRSVHGEANTLRKLGRNTEALQVYLVLLQLDPNRYSYSSYINYRAHIPEVYMKLGMWKEAEQFMSNDPDLLGYTSTMTTCLWSKALCDFVLKRETKFGSSYFYSGGSTPNIITALINVPYVLDFLTEQVSLPDLPIPMMYCNMRQVGGRSIAHQAVYAAHNKELWKSIPGALKWAQQNMNTLICIQMFKPDMYTNLPIYAKSIPKSYENFEKIVNSDVGIFINDVPVNANESTLIHEVVLNDDVRFLKLMVNKGASIKPPKVQMLPIHLACYYDRSSAIIEYLIDNGVDVEESTRVGISAVEMTANQGNWKAMAAVFRKVPYLKDNKELLHKLADHLFDSSVYFCVNGKKRCQRCIMKDLKHSRDVSFEKCLKLLFAYGFQPSRTFDLPSAKAWAPLVKLFRKYNKTRPNITEELASLPPMTVTDIDVLDLLQHELGERPALKYDPLSLMDKNPPRWFKIAYRVTLLIIFIMFLWIAKWIIGKFIGLFY